jgi:hypothetical protein
MFCDKLQRRTARFLLMSATPSVLVPPPLLALPEPEAVPLLLALLPMVVLLGLGTSMD